MNLSTHKRRTAAATISAAVLTIVVPVAQAQTPDAFERAVQSHPSESRTFLGSPDAIDRAIAAREAQRKAMVLDARERSLTERPAATTSVAPDAFERALTTHTDALTTRTMSQLNARERALTERPTIVSPAAVTVSEGFDWGDFWMGAGAGIGLVLVAGLGGLLIRRSQTGLTTA
jgi:hypothetical protein